MSGGNDDAVDCERERVSHSVARIQHGRVPANRCADAALPTWQPIRPYFQTAVIPSAVLDLLCCCAGGEGGLYARWAKEHSKK